MKHAFIALALIAAQPSHARIGETAQEITARFGQGNKSGDRLSAPGAETYKYEKSGFFVEVVLLNGTSVWEIFKRKDQNITDDDIKAFLKLYDSPATTWRFDRKDKRWERSGKPKLVAYKWPGHEDFFCIKDIELCGGAEKKGKGAVKDL